ncbi:MAG: N-acetylmuramoyl-L-alanine amidase [Flavobacteriaceae bacterium]|nr:N-acetylmuramoyl-L-alanine amidase [Flavobacteriaceae bacterium]
MKSKYTLLILVLLGIAISYSFVNRNNNTIKEFIVVLDAGHGGKDYGNMGNGYLEKNIALDVTLQVGKILESQPNMKVIYTRKTDVFIELDERAPIANEVDADIFVSIHCNSHHTQAYGAETFVMGLNKSKQNLNTAKKENEVIFLEENYEETYAGFDPNAPESLIGLTIMQEEYLDQSIMLAGLIQNNIVNNLKRRDRSVKQDVFWVLHHSYMPSVLVELGFLTHKKEGPYVNSKKGRREMAREIANGIITYRKNLALGTSDFQNPTITEAEIEEAINEAEEKIYKDITFMVQLAASGKKLETKAYNFKGLKEVTRNKEDGLYKYYYGETSDYNKIQLMKTYAREKGYSSAYVVAFKNNKKLKLSEVLKTEPQQ